MSAQEDKEIERMDIEHELEHVAALQEDDIITALEKRSRAFDRLLELAASRTNYNHWLSLGDDPYLRAGGAELLARRFGVSLKFRRDENGEAIIRKVWAEDDNGRYYLYTVEVNASLRGWGDIDVIGCSSSRDKFFALRADPDDPSGKRKVLRPVEEVDEISIKKKCINDGIRNAIVRLLGIRGITWEQLKEWGIDREKIKSVRFKSKGGKGGSQRQGSSGRQAGATGQQKPPGQAPTKPPANEAPAETDKREEQRRGNGQRGGKPTENQLDYLHKLAGWHGCDGDEVVADAREHYNFDEVSAAIDRLKGLERDEVIDMSDVWSEICKG